MRRRNRWVKTLFWGSVLGVFALLGVVFSGVAVGAFEQRTLPVEQPVPLATPSTPGAWGFPAATATPPWSMRPTPGFPPRRPA